MNTYTDISSEALIQEALKRGEGRLTDTEALLTTTGSRTGRSPADRFIVMDEITESQVDWGKVNRPFGSGDFDRLWERVTQYMRQRSNFIGHFKVGAAQQHSIQVQVTTETAWHCLFAQNMFIECHDIETDSMWQVMHAAHFVCVPERDRTTSDAAVIINFAQRKVLLAGMKYAGELKKSMFSVQNFLLPNQDILPMHCAANVGQDGDTCLFFGLSGTGKTTLSADPDRLLIGDDEHGWGRNLVFNLEGGCYAKTIDLSRENEPLIWDAIHRGAILENVMVDQKGKVDFGDVSITKNGRCSYPLEHIKKRCEANMSGEPNNVIFLTCDVSGVFPPVAILSKEAAAYHFISGYTARIGSTEVGSHEDISPTFSYCFGAPFMPHPVSVYAALLMRNIETFGTHVYLVNTGWSGGSGGEGKRFPIPVTRSIVSAIHKGLLKSALTEHLDTLNLDIPVEIPGVEKQYLNPRNAWPDKQAYDTKARQLAELFSANIASFDVSQEIIAAGVNLTA